MKLVFRLNFHTFLGQSMWLKLATVCQRSGMRSEWTLPLRWINAQQWQVEMDVHGDGPLAMEYFYQLRQDYNGVELDEWNGPRTTTADPCVMDVLLLKDDWCSAGTVDYAFETDAFHAMLPTRRKKFAAPVIAADADHEFRLRMAAVPAGLVPCLLGSAPTMGEWDWHRAVPMSEVAANFWQANLQLPADWWIEYKYGLYDPKLSCVVRLEEGENRTLEVRSLGGRQRTVICDERYRRGDSELPRAAGVAVPVFSLRGEQSLGVGEFADLKQLGSWSARVGLKLIQILPINDTTSSHAWTDSYPYSAVSVFALHPIYLRIEDMGYQMPPAFLVELDAAREWLNALGSLDYEEVMKAKKGLTRQIFAAHHQEITSSARFQKFLTENREWLVPYAVFCVNRDAYGCADFSQWGEWAVFDRVKAEAMAEMTHPQWPEVSYHIWLQYELDRQLTDTAEYLHARGIALKGDLPIGIDRHSADAWSSPHWFKMGAQAGAPPDAFAVKGQNWGFPTYHWEVMREDGYAWWRNRFAKLSRYFDAYRIDHILGFFRIWQIPLDHVEGIMGSFDPALPLHIDQIRARGIPFDFNRYCRPCIHRDILEEKFGETAAALRDYLEEGEGGLYQLREHVSTQRRIVEHFLGAPASVGIERLREFLLDCASDVIFFEVPGSNGTLFHPRCSMHTTQSFLALDHDIKCRLDDLYIDYFYRRQEGFWQACGYEKLPLMRRASTMLLCGEDLGMVPDCVPGVMRELGILALEIQRMPKSPKVEFVDLAHAPYLSVVSPSTHDMSTLRGWWREDRATTGRFASKMLGLETPPRELTGKIATHIIEQHLYSPAMWAIISIQDLLSIDESLRHPDPDAERINIPDHIPHYWRYRMHLSLDELVAADEFNQKLAHLLEVSGRATIKHS